MEQVLDIYKRPYAKDFPIVCMDESPKQMIKSSPVQERYELAKTLGVDRTQAAHELFKDHKGIQDDITYPSLADFKKEVNLSAYY